MSSKPRNSKQDILSNDSYNMDFINKYSLKFYKTEKALNSDNNEYTLMWLKNIDRIIKKLPKSITINKYNFIDVGCGAAIPLIYTNMNYSFKSYKGFDNNKKMINKSNLNIRRMQKENEIYVFQDHAKSIKLENKKLFLLMFNPFGIETLSKFVENNIENLKKNKSIIAYINDHHINIFEKNDLEIIHIKKYYSSVIFF